MTGLQHGGEDGDPAWPVVELFQRVDVGGRETLLRAFRLGGFIAGGDEVETRAARQPRRRFVLMGNKAPESEEPGGDEEREYEKKLAHVLGPHPVPPPQAGEGTLAIGAADEGDALLPLPRSGGGLGRGRSHSVFPSRPARSVTNCQATRPERAPRIIAHSSACARISASGASSP